MAVPVFVHQPVPDRTLGVWLFERLFAPRVLRRIYADELARLDRHARTSA